MNTKRIRSPHKDETDGTDQEDEEAEEGSHPKSRTVFQVVKRLKKQRRRLDGERLSCLITRCSMLAEKIGSYSILLDTGCNSPVVNRKEFLVDIFENEDRSSTSQVK